MARRRDSQRDLSNPNSFRSLDSLLTFKLRPPPVLLPVPSSSPQSVRVAGDRRLFRPDVGTVAPAAVRPGASRVVADQRPRGTARLKFADPQFVAICARRTIRREVLHALKRTKKGAGAKKRRNFWSAISCSRN